MIVYPARNSLDSGKTPSVTKGAPSFIPLTMPFVTIGDPSAPARTTLASSGKARPSAATSTPESFSSLWKACMKAACLAKSCGDHFAYQAKSAFVPVNIRMYFIPIAPLVQNARVCPFHGVVGAGPAFSTSLAFFGGPDAAHSIEHPKAAWGKGLQRIVDIAVDETWARCPAWCDEKD